MVTGKFLSYSSMPMGFLMCHTVTKRSSATPWSSLAMVLPMAKTTGFSRTGTVHKQQQLLVWNLWLFSFVTTVGGPTGESMVSSRWQGTTTTSVALPQLPASQLCSYCTEYVSYHCIYRQYIEMFHVTITLCIIRGHHAIIKSIIYSWGLELYDHTKFNIPRNRWELLTQRLL